MLLCYVGEARVSVPGRNVTHVNGSVEEICDETYTPEFKHVFLALLLYTFCILTVVGNGMVVLAVIQVNIDPSQPGVSQNFDLCNSETSCEYVVPVSNPTPQA